ncbi:MAG: hypothetical protein MJ198_03775 [Bacteroidales bacterium]|nr:hypothetical protein [Bacteroidales bacterium]
MKKVFTILLASLGLAACNSQTKDDSQKILVLYYSQTGATKTVAEEIKQQLNADIEAIEIENPYDGNYKETIDRCIQEIESGTVPNTKALQSNINDYDIIFLGYPVWFGTYAQPIAGLVKNESFEGKKIVTFCTFGSGGLQASTENLKQALPKAEIIEGYGVRNARIEKSSAEINRFLIERGFKQGEIEALPAFMEHKPVTQEDADIFDEACGDYQFPLGTPIDVAVRETKNSTDYEFYVQSKNQNGEDITATIYVTKSKENDSKAEFTQVIR